MRRIKNLFRSIFPRRETYKQIIKSIDRQKVETDRATDAIDKAIAALDGETGWWSCRRIQPTEKECGHAFIGNNTA